MTQSATLLSLRQLTDVALEGHELGTVNFKLLHDILQIIINQLGIEDIKIQYQGSQSELIQKMHDSKPQGAISTTQYTIIDEGVRKPSKIEGGSLNMVVVPTKGEEVAPAFTVALTTEAYEKLTSEVDDLKAKYNELTLMTSNADLMNAVRTSVSSAHGGGGNNPIVEMYQLLSLSKRIEASEAGMAKMASIIEDLAREQLAITQTIDMPDGGTAAAIAAGGGVAAMGGATQAGGAASTGGSTSGGGRPATGGGTSGGGKPGGGAHSGGGGASGGGGKNPSKKPDAVSSSVSGSASKIIENVVKLKSSLDSGPGPWSESLRELERRVGLLEKAAGINVVAVGVVALPGATSEEYVGTHLPKLSETGGPVVGSDFSKIDISQMEPNDAFAVIQKEIKNIRNLIETLDVPQLQKLVEEIKTSGSGGGGGGGGGGHTTPKPGGGGGIGLPPTSLTGEGDISEKMKIIEVNFTQCVDQINSLDSMFHTEMELVANQVASLERELGRMSDKMQGISMQEGGGTETTLMELYKKFTDLENITNNISQSAAQLLDEREEREMNMSALKEQVEMLKTVKADRQDIEAQLADKVDICMINRKVSHEQFDATCMDLTKGIEDALEKLTKQEDLWQQALTEIQTEVGSKLDKMEIGPLKDFITHKLSVLQSKLKALSKIKKEHEAAGTKAAFLKDVKCISCDQDVVMRKNMDPSLLPIPAALPPTKTMAPYLAYELDQLRKQQRNLGISRNLNHFEQAKKGTSCNRYCGGSHTVTTPQQRVTRLGNFLEQWGPEVSTVNDFEFKGKGVSVPRADEKTERLSNVPPPTPGKVKYSLDQEQAQGETKTSKIGFEIAEKDSNPISGSGGGSKTGF